MFIDTDFRKLATLDVSGLVEKVATIPESVWAEDSMRQQAFEAHKATRSIRLVINIEPSTKSAAVHPLYSELKPAIIPVLKKIQEHYNSVPGVRKLAKKNGKSVFVRIILAQLAPKSEIPLHNDSGVSLMYTHRIHCPLITNDECIFFVGKSKKKMVQGELWEINNRRKHGVKNNSNENRVHMIVDYLITGEQFTDIDGTRHRCIL